MKYEEFERWEHFQAFMLAAARLRHAAGTKWGTRHYLDIAATRSSCASIPFGTAATSLTLLVGTAVTLR